VGLVVAVAVVAPGAALLPAPGAALLLRG